MLLYLKKKTLREDSLQTEEKYNNPGTIEQTDHDETVPSLIQE